MFPSSLNIKRKAACAANCKNTKNNISSSKDIEESYFNKSNIESFLKKRPLSKLNKSKSTQPTVQTMSNSKNSKKILKDLSKIPNDQFIIIEDDSEVSDSDEIYLRDRSSQIHSPLKSDRFFSQSIKKQNDSLKNKNCISNQSVEKQDYSIEATHSGSTTASNEFMIEEDIAEIYEPSLCKKAKIEQGSSNRSCNRKDSLLSTSSDTYIIYGSSNDRSNISDDLFVCTSSASSNISTSSFSPSNSKNDILNKSPSTERNVNSNIELHDLSTSCNLLTRSNSIDLQSESSYMQFNQKEQEEKRQKVNEQIEQGRKLVEQRMGRLAAEDQVINGFPCCTFTIRCFLKHSFVVNVEDLLCGTWCNKCEENLQKAKEYAEENNGILLSEIYSKTLKFKCSKNHCWESSHSTYKSRWCPQCKKIIKDQFKQFIKEEEEKKSSEYQNKQEEMYQEARRRAMGSVESSSEEYKSKVIMAAKQVEKEVEKIAEQQANDYIKNEQNNCESPCSFMQLKQMFKIILFPDTILQVYYTNLEETELKTEYRNIARYVHPDKNFHSRAGESFQKLNNFYNLALPKV